MRHSTTSAHPVRRTLVTLAAAASLALSLGATGCMDPGEDGGDFQSIVCPAKVDAWAPGTTYKVGDLVSFNGATFQCRQAHKVADSGWTPVAVPALWSPVQCAAAPIVDPPPTGGGVQQPPANPPPANNGGAVQGGVFDAKLDDLFTARLFTANVNATIDPSHNFTQVTNVAVAGVGDINALLSSGAARKNVTSVNGVEDLVVKVNATGEIRLHIRRNKAAGVIEAAMVGAPSDQRSPFVTRVRKENGLLIHTLACDVSNNQKNDLFAKVGVDAQLVETGANQSGAAGGINGIATIAEAREIVRDLNFPGLKGF